LALQGTLEDFPIADIFQLIGQQRKTGILVLNSDPEEVRVFFHEGRIFRAQPVDRKKTDLLGDMLVRAKLINVHQLEEALEAQKTNLKRIGEILVDAEALDRETVQKVATLQTCETVYALFNWKSGTYRFDPGKLEIATDLPDPIPAENVLMEGFRRVDEWPMILKNVPSLDIVFERVVDLDLPGAGLKKKKKDKYIGDNERAVYEFVDGRRTTQEVVDQALLGEFEACKALWNLMNAGAVRKAGAGTGVHEAEEEEIMAVLPGMFFRGVVGAVFTLVVVILVGGAVLGLMQVTEEGGAAGAGQRPLVDEGCKLLVAEAQRARITRALEAYAFRHSEYPEQLEALLEESDLDEEDLAYPWSSPYVYERDERRGFFLLNPKH
jgi:hypothetical protein